MKNTSRGEASRETASSPTLVVLMSAANTALWTKLTEHVPAAWTGILALLVVVLSIPHLHRRWRLQLLHDDEDLVRQRATLEVAHIEANTEVRLARYHAQLIHRMLRDDEHDPPGP
jgi:hypothetical protein